ncbi:ATP-dependent helicase [bacterium]|nr:ATP-dependent helicase [bacterium]MCI0565994.1 ATP-dependent helicase [bacterium]
MILDSEQQKAAHAQEPRIIIAAGPGSGKTSVLVERIAAFIEHGADPASILPITFTNKAARELERRLGERLKPPPSVHTFHSLALNMLTDHGDRVGLPEGWSILSDSEQHKIARESIRGLGRISPQDAIRMISRMKIEPAFKPSVFAAGRIKTRYDEALLALRLLDFDDILIYACALLRGNNDVREEYEETFRHICVDEYQDTNAPQAILLRLIGMNAETLSVIGDPDQAIYGFRGATRSHFLSFDKTYPGSMHYTLARNYRSTEHIVSGASRVIEKNAPKEYARTGKKGAHIKIITAPTGADEALYIAREIERLMGGISLSGSGENPVENEPNEMYHLGDIAVIVRLRAVGETIGEKLRERGIPCLLMGEKPLCERPEIRVILETLQDKHFEENRPFSEEMRNIITEHGLERARQPEKYFRALGLVHMASRFDSLPASEAKKHFFDDLLLMQKEDEEIPLHAVPIITAHAAKGLEFPVVFIAGAEKGLFPYIIAKDDDGNGDGIEEERRLLYVAMTRAKERLYLSHTENRTLFGEYRETGISPFLKNLPEDTVEKIIIQPRAQKPLLRQERLF